MALTTKPATSRAPFLLAKGAVTAALCSTSVPLSPGTCARGITQSSRVPPCIALLPPVHLERSTATHSCTSAVLTQLHQKQHMEMQNLEKIQRDFLSWQQLGGEESEHFMQQKTSKVTPNLLHGPFLQSRRGTAKCTYLPKCMPEAQSTIPHPS